MTRAILSAVAACLILAGCSSRPHLFTPPPTGDEPAAGGGFSATLLRNASGAPSGVRLSWEAVPDVAGYNVYRDFVAIPDTARGDTSKRVNASPIPAVPVTGTVSFDDLFPTVVGDEWHYRVSSVDADGDESELSPEGALTITDFIVTQLVTTQAGVGDPVEIIGENFGSYDPTSDTVSFQGVRLEADGSIIDALLVAPVTEWGPSRITCTVPLGATKGEVQVQSNGLSQDTPEEFSNTDPYIEQVTPVTGHTDDIVTVIGHNFGTGPDSEHRVFLGNTAVPAAQTLLYSDTQIQFIARATGPASYLSPQAVTVRVDAKISNNGQFSIVDRAPVASFTVSPEDAQTPATIEFDGSASSDPDNVDTITFAWDFDGDGNIDLDSASDPTVTHVYDKSGDYAPVLYVSDSISQVSSISMPLHISLSRLQLMDNGNFAPGTEFFEIKDTVQINYILQGGEPDYSIDWFLEDPNNLIEYKIATDTGLTPGTTSKQFILDSSNPVPQPGSGKIPAGTWRLRAEAHDGGAGNDPDPVMSWPTFANGSPGVFKVYRANVLLVLDAEGDPLGEESQFINQQLTKSGYKTGGKPSPTLTLGDMTSRDVVIWAADGPHGPSSYEWLGRSDLILASQYMDTGGALVIFGPPNGFGVKPFDQLQTFSDNYQSFDIVSQAFPPATVNVYDFSGGAGGGHFIHSLQPSAIFGGADVTSAPPGASYALQMDFLSTTGTPTPVAGFTANDTVGWRTYVGMFQPSKVAVTDPAGATVDQLVDNIVWNTAKKLP